MIRGRTLGHIVGETTGVIPRYAAPKRPVTSHGHSITPYVDIRCAAPGTPFSS